MATLQAILTLSIVGNAVLIGWGWQGFSKFLDMLEIQVDRGDGKGFVFLTYDTTPNYTDTTPFPATPTKWKYRAIYRVGDAQVVVNIRAHARFTDRVLAACPALRLISIWGAGTDNVDLVACLNLRLAIVVHDFGNGHHAFRLGADINHNVR